MATSQLGEGWELHAGTRLHPTEAAFLCPPQPGLLGLPAGPTLRLAEPAPPTLQPGSQRSLHSSTLSSCSETSDGRPLHDTYHTQGG